MFFDLKVGACDPMRWAVVDLVREPNRLKVWAAHVLFGTDLGQAELLIVERLKVNRYQVLHIWPVSVRIRMGKYPSALR